MMGFLKNRPACPRKNTPGQRIWLVGKDGVKFALPTQESEFQPTRWPKWSADYLIVYVDAEKTKHRGWIRYNHRLERKRRAL